MRQPRADPTAADDAEGAAGQLDAAQGVPGAVIAAPEQAVAGHKLFGEGDHEAKGVLRDRFAIGFGRIHDRDAARGGGCYVHVVIADAVAADDAQPGGGGDHVGGEPGGAQDDDGGVGEQGLHRFRAGVGRDNDGAGGAQEGDAAVVDRLDDKDLASIRNKRQTRAVTS